MGLLKTPIGDLLGPLRLTVTRFTLSLIYVQILPSWIGTGQVDSGSPELAREVDGLSSPANSVTVTVLKAAVSSGRVPTTWEKWGPFGSEESVSWRWWRPLPAPETDFKKVNHSLCFKFGEYLLHSYGDFMEPADHEEKFHGH